MQIKQTDLAGLLLIEPQRFRDERGFFLESYQVERYRDSGILDTFVQDNHSRSMKGALRGLHFQVKHPQSQLLTVMRGRIFDVAVDLRQPSLTFGRWFGAELSEDGPRQIYMAPGFAHGFCVLSDFADLHYKVSRIYDHADEGGLLWNDPEIGIRWPIEAPIVSKRDGAYPRLRDLDRQRLPHVAAE
ncbi:MAG: dTDP-4-dehydrorhamnose 3,5-epimerase [Rhizobiales bacterium]|nr:dTDP-4-dehydrorhamnose 3,5-epimerase [Hyphomicrobiales bacterium]